MTVTAYIALGSNLGDRQGYLDRALTELRARPGIEVIRVSHYLNTKPVGGPPGQGPYLNAAAELRTTLEPKELLGVLLEVEQMLGRERHERFGPRTIDLDLLLYGDLVCNDADLTVPHPRMHERRFVLEPLAEIAPQAMHPLAKSTVRLLLENLADEAGRAGDVSPSVMPATVNSVIPGRTLKGLRTLVTGSTSGIGRAIALQFAAAGADVLVHGRKAAAADEVADLIKRYGVRAELALADLREPEDCLRLADRAWDQWNGLDILVSNAGADILTGAGASWSFLRKLHELYLVDVQATTLICRQIGERMKERGSGVILTIGWDQAETGMEGDSGQLFGAAKGAVMAFTKSLARSLAPQVRVNCLAPGWIRTAWGAQASVGWQQRVERETLLQRWGTPEDVAAAAHWLVSPAAAFFTGQTIRVNGGAVR
jgi:2-amino-4-hydroxy-6-hydroxymethyldihydropteridine diphosphokinase